MVASSETAEHVIATFRRAALLNAQTRSLRGNMVVLSAEDADDLMITADLHGHRLNFQKLLEAADLAHHPRRHLVLQEVCHGGPLYPSGRGCMSHLLLEDVAQLKVTYPDRVHYLMSNHELAELTDFPITKGKRMLNLLFRCGLQEMYGDAADRVRAAALQFLSSCPLALRTTTGQFVCHSVPELVDQEGFDSTIFDRSLEQGDLKPGGAVFQLVWGRDFRRENAAAFAHLVNATVLIHGHEPCPEGFFAPNDLQVILDCCGERACYLLLPLDQPLTHQQVVERIQQVR